MVSTMHPAGQHMMDEYQPQMQPCKKEGLWVELTLHMLCYCSPNVSHSITGDWDACQVGLWLFLRAELHLLA